MRNHWMEAMARGIQREISKKLFVRNRGKISKWIQILGGITEEIPGEILGRMSRGFLGRI